MHLFLSLLVQQLGACMQKLNVVGLQLQALHVEFQSNTGPTRSGFQHRQAQDRLHVRRIYSESFPVQAPCLCNLLLMCLRGRIIMTSVLILLAKQVPMNPLVSPILPLGAGRTACVLRSL